MVADAEANQLSLDPQSFTTLRAANTAVKWLHALEEAYKDRVEARGQRGIAWCYPLVCCDWYAQRQQTETVCNCSTKLSKKLKQRNKRVSRPTLVNKQSLNSHSRWLLEAIY